MTSDNGLLELPPLSLYVHIPWCIKKCPYCDFNSHTNNEIPEKAYVEALIRDMEAEAKNREPRHLSSIFFGGGTPSLFSPSSIAQIIDHANRFFQLDRTIEITLEANPGTFEQDRFCGFAAAGVNRLSVGVQSFDDRQLRALGRVHDSVQARQAIEAAQQSGFSSLNIDLMFGLPEQSFEQALKDIEIALATGVQHISWYQLTIEKNTAFYSSPPQNLPEDDALFNIQSAGQSTLKNTGFEHYEVSAFALNGYSSRHNLNNWQFGDYIGIGAGAHGKNTELATNTISRYRKTRLPNDYLNCYASSRFETPGQTHSGRLAHRIPQSELVFEFMMNALRLNRPCSFELFEKRTGLPHQIVLPELHSLATDNLIKLTESNFQTTPQGQLFLNDVLASFL